MVRRLIDSPLCSQFSVLAMVFALGLAGCDGGDPPPTHPAAPIIQTFTVSPEHLETPGEVTVSWTTEEASSIELQQGEQQVDLGDQDPAQGSVTLAVSESTTFTLEARSAGGAVTASKEVTVNPLQAPSIGLFDAPDYVEADAAGEAMAELRWAGVERAETLQLLAAGQEPVELDASASEGSLDLRITEATTFTLVAANEGGEASREVTVQVAYQPVIEVFEADRLLVGLGEAAGVHWITSGAAYVEIWLNETQHLEEGPAQGSEEVPLVHSSTLELRAINEVGTTVTGTLEIDVGAPSIVELQTSAAALWLGESLELSWETIGGSSLDITHTSTGEAICQVEGYAEIAESSCAWAPTEVGTHSITFSLVNLSGVAARVIELFVSDGPTITHFGAGPEILTAGDDLEIRWAVLADPAGNEPTIRITDDRGNMYPQASGAEGLITTSLLEPGPYELRLEATTDDPRSTPDQAAVSVLVHPQPSVTLDVTPDLFDDSIHEEAVLSWTTQDAETLILYRLEDENPVQVLEVPEQDRAEGTYAFIPKEARRYRLVAANALGWQTDAEAGIAVAPTEVLTFAVNPTSFTQGQPVHLSWTTRMADEVRVNFGTERFIQEETEAPFLDLPALGGTHRPLTSQCTPIDTNGCVEVLLPVGFSFPFGDDTYSRIWVYTTGYLGFDAGSRPDSVAENERFPTTPQRAAIGLAPFWDSLAWDMDRYPTGNIHTALLEEDGAPIFVIQWKDIGYASQFLTSRKASFNFEVVLRQDGSFDYRYGSQSARDTNITSDIVNGSSATIGFQLPDQSDHGLILFNGQGNINGLRDHRTFSYRPLPALPPNGELVFRPLGPQPNFPITLTATRGALSDSESVSLSVARKPSIRLAPEILAPAAMGAEFLIGWTSSNADSLVVLDEEGQTRCTALNQAQINEGLCVLSEAESGRYAYTVRATGANGSVAERTATINVFGAFGVTSFAAESSTVEYGSDLLLRWQTFETVSVTLMVDGLEIYRDDSGAAAGSFLFEGIEEETEFVLVATNDVGATEEASVVVGLLPIAFGLELSSTLVRPGDPITVTLDARVLDGGAPLKVYGVQPLAEIPAPADRFEDISHHANVRLLTTVGNVGKVELPFPFPYMGEDRGWIWASVHGHISFAETLTQVSINHPLPTDAGVNNNVHLAPFWDSLNIRRIGTIVTAHVDPDTFIVQWSQYSMAQGTTTTYPQNLNFQIVLHRNGSFDFRYGAMEPHPTYRPATGCFPNTCVNEVNASAATIGYQQIAGVSGHTLHFGGTNPAAENPPFKGGLSNRTFRYTVIDGSGSFTFRPNQSEDMTLCVDHALETFCKEIALQVPFGFSSVDLSRDEIEPGESITLSWQSIGGTTLRILDGDTVVHTTSDLAEIDSGSVTFKPTRNTFYDLELVAGRRQEIIRRWVEVNRLSLTANATASIGPGQPVTISWNLQSSDPSADLHVLAPMEELPTSGFDTFNIEYKDDAILLLGAGSDSETANLSFDDFTFPYFGTVNTSVWVSTDGFLAWDSHQSHPGNNALPGAPTNAARATPVIVPFWDDIHTRVNGKVLAMKFDEDRYVIQWSHVSLRWGSVDTNEGDLNFLVVLDRDGSFEYHFGLMREPGLPAASTTECNPLSCEKETNGSSATMGYQLPDSTAGYQIHFGGMNRNITQHTVPGGLRLRSWRFTPQRTAGTGSAVIHPAESSLLKLCAIESGASQLLCAPAMPIDVPWRIDLFQANPTAPRPGESVSLNWSVQGADTLRILEGETELLAQTGTDVQLLGTLPITPGGTTTYTLEIDWMDRSLSRDLTVAFRTFDLQVSAPPAAVKPGDVVVVNWELTQHSADTPVMISPLSELEIGPNGENGFVDVSQLEGAQEVTLSGTNGSANVAIPFSFPYLGTQQSSLQVFADGYISFTGNGGNALGTNTFLPDSGTTQRRIQMAVFWDDMILRGGDSVWRYAPDPSTLIIQWKGFSLALGSSASVRYDLNFQAVLRSDGSFDYRYGTMAPPPPPFSDPGCMPENCSSEANGSSATIGYQTLDGLYGSTFHIGSLSARGFSSGSIDSFLPFPGGLSSRSFRYAPAPTGASRVVVGRSGIQEVCAIIAGFGECKSVPTAVVADAGELMITEVLIDPAAGQRSQWIEVRNLTDRTIDMAGFELRSNQGSHRITDPLPVPPEGFVTLAASTQVPFTPDYVYDDEVPLNRLFDSLELLVGQGTVNKLVWGIGSTVPHDQVLSLDPGLHLHGIQENIDFGSWCLAGSAGTPGTLGAGCLSPWYDVDPISDRPFLDIASTGTRFHDIEGDNLVARLPSTGFQVNIFGEKYSRLWVTSGGRISLHDFEPGTTAVPSSLPRTEGSVDNVPGPLIAAFWDSLQCHEVCQVFYERRDVSGEDVLIIQWENFQVRGGVSTGSAPDSRAGSITIQAQLWANGDVVTSYKVSNPFPVGHSSWSAYHGVNTWIGLEALDHNTFVSAHLKRPMPFDQRSILFRAKWTE